MKTLGLLDAAIRNVCPIDGVSVGDPADKSTWRIDYATGATDQQKTAALAVVSGFDPSAPDPDITRRAAIRANPRTMAIVNALTTQGDAGLVAAVAARYPGLTGDGLKAITDMALALAYIYRG